MGFIAKFLSKASLFIANEDQTQIFIANISQNQGFYSKLLTKMVFIATFYSNQKPIFLYQMEIERDFS